MNSLTAYLISTLQCLPENGLRLSDGLALRLSRGNGWYVLGCSRVGAAPDLREMERVCAAVVAVYRPSQIWRGQLALQTKGGLQHYILRLYWPFEELDLVYESPTQEGFPF
jgi:hypothetical protein